MTDRIGDGTLPWSDDDVGNRDFEEWEHYHHLLDLGWGLSDSEMADWNRLSKEFGET